MSKIILVVINGHAGVGKDTFVNICKEYAKYNYDLPVFNYHRSDAPKNALISIGWDGKKDATSREILKQLVDYMEHTGLLNQYLKKQLRWIKYTEDRAIVFYHVRDPKVIDALMEKYKDTPDLYAMSLLISRDMPEAQEPADWWDLEQADYTIKLSLPTESEGLTVTKGAAASFIDFLTQYLNIAQEVQ